VLCLTGRCRLHSASPLSSGRLLPSTHRAETVCKCSGTAIAHHDWVAAQAVWLGGTTVLIDQPYPSFPDNMGHWAEVLVPLYNLLTSGPWRRSHTHVDTILFGNLQRSQLDVSLSVLAGHLVLWQSCALQCAVWLLKLVGPAMTHNRM
jgi:hypothetical protein